MKNIIGTFTLTLLIFIAPANPFAHSFSVALIVGSSNPYSEQINADFLRAAKEHDGHPDETADGHLGGLDVHILHAADAEELTTLFSKQPIDISVSFVAADLSNNLQKLAIKNGGIFINAAYKDQPDQGYLVAQHIDTAIRSTGGFDNIDAVTTALKHSY